MVSKNKNTHLYQSNPNYSDTTVNVIDFEYHSINENGRSKRFLAFFQTDRRSLDNFKTNREVVQITSPFRVQINR